ncbi:MAG TPA: hypothetical protein VK531_14895 [Gemmatimonadales bacterium]|nr:hypothetical protein [Gemmatimonadales bacterium]
MRRQLQDEMHVVANDAEPENSRDVPTGNLWEHPSQKLRGPGVDER